MKISDLYWPVTFFSTAFGAGIFFLPQAVGPAVLGMIPFLIFITFAMLVSLMAHYLFFKFISFHPKKDFLEACSDFLGRRSASVVCSLFIVSMMIIVIINFIALVNVVNSFFNNRLISRFFVSLTLSSILSVTWFFFNSKVEKLISKIAFFSIISVIGIAIFLFFQPTRNSLSYSPGVVSFKNLTLLPIFIFTFNFTPCIQRFIKNSEYPKSRELIIGKITIFIFILVFVIAVSRLLTLEDISAINYKNIDALSYTVTLIDKQFVWLGAVLLLALLTAGAYTGTLTGVIDGVSSFGTLDRRVILICNVLICTIVGTANPGIVKIIASGSMPVIVITVFFIPAIYFIMKGKVVIKVIGFLVMLSGAAIIAMLFV